MENFMKKIFSFHILILILYSQSLNAEISEKEREQATCTIEIRLSKMPKAEVEAEIKFIFGLFNNNLCAFQSRLIEKDGSNVIRFHTSYELFKKMVQAYQEKLAAEKNKNQPKDSQVNPYDNSPENPFRNPFQKKMEWLNNLKPGDTMNMVVCTA
jgi:hypothetical protein